MARLRDKMEILAGWCSRMRNLRIAAHDEQIEVAT